MADRFFTETTTKTRTHLKDCNGSKILTLKPLLVRNIPELSQELSKVSNAFIPWGNAPNQKYWDDLKAKVFVDLAGIVIKNEVPK
jgi:hypothetical protein